MILQRLIQYYDRLSADPELGTEMPRAGYSRQKISFCVVLNPDGTLLQIESLLDSGGRRPTPTQMAVPGEAKPSGSGLNPCFLWDNSAYMLGFRAGDPKPERTARSFDAFRDKHLSLEPSIESDAYRAVCAFLRHWRPDQMRETLEGVAGTLGSFGVFRLAGRQSFVHQEQAVSNYWSVALESETPSAGRSLASGRIGDIARLHEPKIKGVKGKGSQSAGALLVSFNEDAYWSFGKEQGINAPVSKYDAFRYANALNYLLRTRDRHVVMGDTTVTFWSSRPTEFENFVSDMFAAPLPRDVRPEDTRRTDQVRRFLSQLRTGQSSGDAIKEHDETPFYVLGLSPNAARIAVRFWIDTNVGDMKARLREHLSDFDLVGARDNEPPMTIRRIVDVAGRADPKSGGYDSDAVPPLLPAALLRAVLTGGPYPLQLLQVMLARIRADGVVSHTRVAAVKAVITRFSRQQGRPMEVPVALDRERTEPGYLTGRLFALLEKAQEDSTEGELNATIKDRYFSSASATPRFVFPRLIRLSQHHLARMERGRKIYFDRRIGEVMSKLSDFAPHFGLEDQGLFAIGYFHERRDLFTRKDEKEGDAQ